MQHKRTNTQKLSRRLSFEVVIVCAMNRLVSSHTTLASSSNVNYIWPHKSSTATAKPAPGLHTCTEHTLIRGLLTEWTLDLMENFYWLFPLDVYKLWLIKWAKVCQIEVGVELHSVLLLRGGSLVTGHTCSPGLHVHIAGAKRSFFSPLLHVPKDVIFKFPYTFLLVFISYKTCQLTKNVNFSF